MATQTLTADEVQTQPALRSDLDRVDELFDQLKDNRFAMAATTAVERKRRIGGILNWVNSHRDDIVKAGYDDFRKPEAEVLISEIYAVTSEAKHTMRHLRRWMKPKKVRAPLSLLSTSSKVIYEPKGVTLIIAPWNYPFCLCIGPLISAIAAGNTVCLKPSEMTPAMSGIIRKLVSDCFPENEVAVFEGEVDVATALLDKPFNHIFFTGSPQVGKIVMKAAARHLATVTLELGGKSPTIVDETADPVDAAAKIAWGKWINNGQTCIAPDYLMVHEAVYEPFKQALIEKIKLSYGNSPQERKNSPYYARIVNGRHFSRLKRLLNDSTKMGGKIAFGGETDEATCFMEPTLLENVPLDAPAMQEEIFGPVLPMMSYKNLDEVVNLVNSKEKPLALYLFSRNKQNKNMIMAQTSAGGSCINEIALHFLHPNLPFGGINNSGIGSAHGHYGFLAFSHERAVLSHHKYSILKLMAPPYEKLGRRLIDFTLKYF